jgi:hypothetical protein
MAARKRNLTGVWIMALFMGWLEFSSVSRRPSFALYRTLDIIELVTSGLLFGVAAGVGILAWTGSRTTERVVVIQQELDQILADTTAASVTVDRARLLQLRERLEAVAQFRR